VNKAVHRAASNVHSSTKLSWNLVPKAKKPFLERATKEDKRLTVCSPTRSLRKSEHRMCCQCGLYQVIPNTLILVQCCCGYEFGASCKGGHDKSTPCKAKSPYYDQQGHCYVSYCPLCGYQSTREKSCSAVHCVSDYCQGKTMYCQICQVVLKQMICSACNSAGKPYAGSIPR